MRKTKIEMLTEMSKMKGLNKTNAAKVSKMLKRAETTNPKSIPLAEVQDLFNACVAAEVAATKKKVASAKAKAKEKPLVKVTESKPDKASAKAAPKADPTDLDSAYDAAFPATIEHDGLTLYRAADATVFPRFDTVKKALEDSAGEESPIYFAVHINAWWNKHYANEMFVERPDEFPHNLDVLDPLHCCTMFDRICAVSMYTEAYYMLNHVGEYDAFSADEHGIRRTQVGIPFEVYTTTAPKGSKKAPAKAAAPKATTAPAAKKAPTKTAAKAPARKVAAKK